MQKVTTASKITDDELKTIDSILNNRENFKPGCLEWFKNIVSALFCYCCKTRRDEFFRKGRKKITLDLDLRSYIKTVKNTKLL